jgi:hypothetical protein
MLSMLISLLAVTVVLYIDLALLEVPLLAEGHPIFSNLYIIRSCLIALSSSFIVTAIVQFSHRRDDCVVINRGPAWESWGTIRWFPETPTGQEYYSIGVKQLITLLLALLSIGFVFLFLKSPGIFSRMGEEDRPIEVLSAAILLLNCVVFVYAAIALFRNRKRRELHNVLIALVFAFVFFLIAMEEVSWFQRYLEIETTGLFLSNEQKEMNLHNFATDLIENAYYFSSFIFLILVPFLIDHGIPFGNYQFIRIFAPSRFLVFPSALFVSYNYDMWNIFITQFAFFITLFILLYYARAAWQGGHERLLLLTILTVYVLSQVVFLVFGDRFERLWDITEYKELLIPMAFLFYAFEVMSRVLKLKYTPALTN